MVMTGGLSRGGRSELEMATTKDIIGSGLQVTPDGREATVAFGALPSGRLEFASGAKHLRIGVDQDIEALMRVRFEGSTPRVFLDRGSVIVRNQRLPMPLAWRRRPADARLNPSVPWELVIRGGVANARVDLRGLELTTVWIGGGASNVDVWLPETTRAVAVRIAGGASSVRLLRPKDVPTRLQLAGGASKLEFDGDTFGAIGGRVRLQSDRFDEASACYDIRVEGGASRLNVGAA